MKSELTSGTSTDGAFGLVNPEFHQFGMLMIGASPSPSPVLSHHEGMSMTGALSFGVGGCGCGGVGTVEAGVDGVITGLVGRLLGEEGVGNVGRGVGGDWRGGPVERYGDR